MTQISRDAPSSGDLEALLEAELLVCVGTGGVGKTTCAAALALGAAKRGRRVAVITIDPARRLANALGLEALDDEARAIPVEARAALGLSEDAVFHACALDTQRSFDRLVERFAPDAETRDRIQSNRMYQQLASSLAGSVEYAAMERVQEISTDPRFDLVVVDTPPSSHALDFLEAPAHLSEFLESRLVQTLVHPAMAAGRFSLRVFERAMRGLLGQLERITGLHFLEDLSELLIAIESLTKGLEGGAQELSQRLRSDAARFILVTSPSPQIAERGEAFLDQLRDAGIAAHAVVANRVRFWPGTPQGRHCAESWLSDSAARHAAAEDLATSLRAFDVERARGDGPDEAQLASLVQSARTAVELASVYASQVALDRKRLLALQERAQSEGLAYVEVPELPADVRNQQGLVKVEAALLGAPLPQGSRE